MEYLEPTTLDLNSFHEKRRLELFLLENGIKLDDNVDYSIVIKVNNVIKASCSKSKNVLKCFAIAPEFRGLGYTAKLINCILDKMFEQGIYHSFIFTKPDNEKIFTACNYKMLYESEDSILLESGIYDINEHMKSLAQKFNIDCNTERAAGLINCKNLDKNFFSHLEKYCKNNEELIIFLECDVLENNQSLFNIRQQISHYLSNIKNVKIISNDEYIITYDMFPKYFLDESKLKRSYIEIAFGIFEKYYCSYFNIKRIFKSGENYYYAD
jgi:[citrate (pro-3S)-lyase] ligase